GQACRAGFSGRVARRNIGRGWDQDHPRTDFPFYCWSGWHGTPATRGTFMADVTQSVGVFEQIRLIAGLRWRILRNSLRKKNNRLDLMGLIFTGVFSGILVIGFCFTFYAGAHAFVSQGRLEWMALLFWGIFIFWQVFPVFVAGFGANFEFRTLLRFPLSLRAFYIIGLAYGFADFSALAAILGVVTAFACWPRPGSNRPSSSCPFSIEFRAPSPVRGSVQCLLVASVCHAIPRGRAQ